MLVDDDQNKQQSSCLQQYLERQPVHHAPPELSKRVGIFFSYPLLRAFRAVLAATN
jgi:hypothetical protein